MAVGSEIFLQLAVVLAIALLAVVVMQHLRQPLLVGYILAGIVIGPAVLNIVRQGGAIDYFGKIGVVLLLFILGLGLKPALIRDIGRICLITGIGQILVTAGLGYPLARLLGYPPMSALYLSLAFTFSSTIIILQLLYTKEEQDTLYGRIAIGFLIVQDIVALFLILLLTSVDRSVSGFGGAIEIILIKLIGITSIGYLISRELVPRIDVYFARRREVLVLFALATCFGLATLFQALEFSLELGALVAGVLLASSPYQHEIASRLAPLRDFFLLIFFVVLGMQVSSATISENWPMILAFSLFILIGNPLIVMALMRRFSYTVETSFLASLTVAQISEFSLILIATGVAVGHLPPTLLGPATVVGLITIFVSSYLIINNRALYKALEPILIRFLGSDIASATPHIDSPEAVLFGCHRLGRNVVDALRNLGLNCLVIDHDPDIIRVLQSDSVACVFGSAANVEFLESLPLPKAQIIISTIPEVATNLTLIESVRRQNKKTVIICLANHQRHATSLYVAGATYVIVPPYLGRRYLVELLNKYGLHPYGYVEERKRYKKELLYTPDIA